MNTPALVSRLDHKALPQWNAGAPGYIAMQSHGAGGGDESRNASRLGTAIRRYWWVALLIWAVIAIPATIGIYKSIKPQYVATGSVNIEPTNVELFSGRENTMPFYSEHLRTQADRMKEYEVLAAAAKKPGLTSLEWFRKLPDQVNYLQQNVRAEAVSATQNIRITMTHNDAASAKAVVDAVIAAYMEDNEKRQEEKHTEAIGQLDALRKDTAEAVAQNQASLNKLLDEEDMSWSEDARRVMAEVLANGRTQLLELERHRFGIQSELDALKGKKLPDKETFLASINTDADPQIQMWNKTQIEKSQQDSELASRLRATEQHPERAAIRRQLRTLEGQIAARRKEIGENAWTKYEAENKLDQRVKVDNLQANLEAVNQQIAALQKHVDNQHTAVRTMSNKEQPIRLLREQIADAKEDLRRYTARYEEVLKQTGPKWRTRESQVGLPSEPSVDRRPKLAMAANAMGMMLGLGVLVILMKLRDKIDHAEDLPNSFQPLVVGTVSHAGAAARGLEGRMSKKILGEEMRLLHANLLPPGPMQRRIMMITSPTPSNGKTSIASQLALSLAKSGLEVLLIDADLRKRDLSTMFDVGFRPGLADLLQGRPPELIRPVELLPNLRLMGAGTKLDRNPVELFQRKHFHESLNLLQEKFDCIVVDTPPTLVVADARLIARSADEVLCVVRAQVSSPKDVNQTLDALQRITGKAPKIILNGVAHKQSYYKYKFAYTSNENEPASTGTTGDTLD